MLTEEIPVGTSAVGFRPKRILVATDFSAAANNAFSHARGIAQLTRAELILIHVIEPDSSLVADALPPACMEELKANAEENLRSLVQCAHKVGIPNTRSLMKSGLPAHEIVEVAKELNVDLIVIATHGFTSWKHFCIGSTAERVARVAPCPVLVVREKERDFI